jgi:hypothetical protein
VLALVAGTMVGACGHDDSAAPPQRVRTRDDSSGLAADDTGSTTTTLVVTSTVAAVVDVTTLPSNAAATTTTTRAPATSATVALAAPSSTTTTQPAHPGPDAAHFRVTVQNTYATPVTVGLGAATANSWTLQPGASAGPVDIGTAEHDGANVARVDDPTCGAADAGGYFAGGHTYRIVVDTRVGDCAEGPSPRLVIHDLTTGTTATI